MSITLYELALAHDIRPSPFCWFTRFALEHKGLPYTAAPLGFTDIPRIGDGSHKTVPVIEDHGAGGGKVIGDSWAIANYLEATYPQRPSLFGGATGRAYALHMHNTLLADVIRPAVKAILFDIYNRVRPEDRDYFRRAREQRIGTTLEQFTSDPIAQRVAAVRAGLEPMRAVAKDQPFLSGPAPLYPDYIVAGFMMWWRAVSPTRLLEADDPLTPWFTRVFGLYARVSKDSTRTWDGP